jgi:hypothetical protein
VGQLMPEFFVGLVTVGVNEEQKKEKIWESKRR